MIVGQYEAPSAQVGLERLQEVLRGYESVLIAYSGGVDSTFLCKVAADALGKNAVAVTARSSTYPARELQEARDFAKQIGIRHIEIDSEELDIPGFAKNDRNRCFYCKQELFSKLVNLSRELSINEVIEGSNLDDNGDYRPGLQAAADLGIKSPMREAGLTKQMIRELSQNYGLPTWNKSPNPCLSTRFPYGTELNRLNLSTVEQAEQMLTNEAIVDILCANFLEWEKVGGPVYWPFYYMGAFTKTGENTVKISHTTMANDGGIFTRVEAELTITGPTVTFNSFVDQCSDDPCPYTIINELEFISRTEVIYRQTLIPIEPNSESHKKETLTITLKKK